jgi:hypothetical protein
MLKSWRYREYIGLCDQMWRNHNVWRSFLLWSRQITQPSQQDSVAIHIYILIFRINYFNNSNIPILFPHSYATQYSHSMDSDFNSSTDMFRHLRLNHSIILTICPLSAADKGTFFLIIWSHNYRISQILPPHFILRTQADRRTNIQSWRTDIERERTERMREREREIERKREIDR